MFFLTVFSSNTPHTLTLLLTVTPSHPYTLTVVLPWLVAPPGTESDHEQCV